MQKGNFLLAGTVEYGKMLQIQSKLVDLRNSGRIDDTVIFTSHEDVFTVGIHDTLNQRPPKGYPDFRIERGGGWTYHGPGQLVVYFIINLKDRGMTVLDLVKIAGKAVIDYLSSLGITGELKLGKETGIWVEGSKICSIGLGIKEFTTIHGIALNIDTDLTKFFLIKPCGFDPSVMTSVRKIIGNHDMESAITGMERAIGSALKLEKVTKIIGIDEINAFIKSVDNGL
ncbi:MAG: lipoyl(octanoyl) transferase LipB [Thermoplasmata archaeon]